MASFNAFKIRLQTFNYLLINILQIHSSSFLSFNRNYINIYRARENQCQFINLTHVVPFFWRSI